MSNISNARYLQVDAGPRYWEDARVNGVEDEDGSLIPFRDGERWRITIDLEDGTILNWPAGTTARIHYKVCDDGDYWLLDAEHRRIFKYGNCSVPSLLAVGDNGYGDYIILRVGADGLIEGWSKPRIGAEDWEALRQADG